MHLCSISQQCCGYYFVIVKEKFFVKSSSTTTLYLFTLKHRIMDFHQKADGTRVPVMHVYCLVEGYSSTEKDTYSKDKFNETISAVKSETGDQPESSIYRSERYGPKTIDNKHGLFWKITIPVDYLSELTKT